ncbi:MAG: hypothetical protein GY810_01815 [Aureispira sp.]|nr:hypothetical protein [Aureispira sp.]
MFNRKLLMFALILGFSTRLMAQQATPIRMLFEPRENTFSLTGAGGGNLYSLFNAAGSASGILGLDANFNLGDKIEEAKEKFQTIAATFKVNLFNSTLVRAVDSMDARRIVFQDNDFRINIGVRYNFIQQKNKKIFKPVTSAFLDMVIVPYQVEGATQGKGFTTLSFNAGGKFGFLAKWGIGVFGITVNPQLDMLFVLESENSFSFEEIMQTGTLPNLNMPKMAKGYIGIGTKIEIPLTDFGLFFDFRKYFKVGAADAAPGLVDRLQFTFGGMALGSIFKNMKNAKPKKKKDKKKKK